MAPFLMFLFGAGSYLAFLFSFLYLIAFIGDLPVSLTIDGGVAVGWPEAVGINLALMVLFALQHSVMARPRFKTWWTKVVPEAIERSAYVLAASGAVALIIWQWRAIPEPVIWNVSSHVAANVIHALFWLGWAILLVSSYLIDHFELFGLSQVFHKLRGSTPKSRGFSTPLLYRHVRHPLYLGFIVGAWATPRMTAGHLMFAIGMTLYVLIGIYFEERDLIRHFGERYLEYRQRVGMLVPWPRKSSQPRP
jgi:methanethiol S-methyltransferase